MSADAARIGLVSISDRASTGVYQDAGLPALREWLGAALVNPVTYEERLIPDEQAVIEATLRALVDDAGCHLVLTTGGTGPAKRDVTPEATLARLLKVSRGTVQNRIDRLLEERTLLGFTVRTTPEASYRIRAVTMVRTEGDADQVLRTLRGLPEVRALHTTNGRWDIVAELATDTLQEFDEALRRIGKVKGVANTETSLLLSTHKF